MGKEGREEDMAIYLFIFYKHLETNKRYIIILFHQIKAIIPSAAQITTLF